MNEWTTFLKVGITDLVLRMVEANTVMRDLTLGSVGWDELIHVAYLLGVMALGVWFTARRLERKLLK